MDKTLSCIDITGSDDAKGEMKMCELFGVSSAKPVIINDYLKNFFNHSEYHPHGWGTAIFQGEEVFIEKEPLQASCSELAQKILRQPIEVRASFAHIRYATIGNIDPRNCHPFTAVDASGRRWTQIHNGTIFEYKPLEPYVKKQEGDTDSERILLYIVDQMNEKQSELGREMDGAERFALLDEIISSMAEGNKLNLMLYDGEIMYVHSNFVGFLHYLQKEGTTIFSTLPVSDEDWKDLPYMQLQGYQAGQQIYQGRQHGHEYIENEENLKFLYQIFSNL